MSGRKKITRFDTYFKLNEAGLSNTRDVVKLSLEDCENIIQDPIFQNILLIRKYIREKKVLEYFNYDKVTSKYRMIAFRKLVELNKLNENDILKLQLEDLDGIINNEDFKNIIILRFFIKKGNSLDYFNENINIKESEELQNEQQ